MSAAPLGFDTEQTLGGRLVVGALASGPLAHLATDNEAVGGWLAGARPWPAAGQPVPSGAPGPEGLGAGVVESRAPGGVLTSRSVLALHNAPYDLGSYPSGERCPAALADTLGLSWLDDENPPHGLKTLVARKLGRRLEDPISVAKPEERALWVDLRDDSKRVLFRGEPIELASPGEVGRYCAEDAGGTAELASFYLGRLSSELLRWWWEVEEPHLRSCIASSHLGLPVDLDGLAPTLEAARVALEAAQAELWGLVGWDLNAASSDQLGAYLYGTEVVRRERHLDGVYKSGRERWRWREVERPGLGLPVPPGREADTTAATLEATGHPVAEAALAVREWTKLVGTYLEPMVERLAASGDGRLHPRINPWGTVTGRVSMAGPNLQTLPTRRSSGKLVKRLVRAQPGHRLVIADYSQLEFRIMYWLSGVAIPAGEDVHQATADRLGISRGKAKTYGYGAVYGAGPGRLAELLGPEVSEAEAKSGLADYFSRLPQVVRWIDGVREQAEQEGVVELPSGRRRHLEDARLDVGGSRRLAVRKAGALRQAVNVKCQGSAADVMRCALAALWNEGVVPVLQVHDAVVLEVPEADARDAAAYLERRMVGAGRRAGVGAELAVDVQVTERWEAA